MVRYLSHYKGPYRIFTVSKNKEMTEQLLAAGLTVGEISEDTLTILPDNIAVTIASEEKARFSVFAEGDVVEINERGILYRWSKVMPASQRLPTATRTALCVRPARANDGWQIIFLCRSWILF